MGTRGILFALDSRDDAELLDRVKPAAPRGFLDGLLGAKETGNSSAHALEFVQAVEQRWDERWLCQTDSAWDPLHRILGDGTLSHSIVPIGNAAVLGGRQFYHRDDHMISYKDAALVREVAAFVSSIDDEEAGRRYDALDQDQYGFPKSSDDRDFTVGWFSALREFYIKAADAGRPVVFHVSQ